MMKGRFLPVTFGGGGMAHMPILRASVLFRGRQSEEVMGLVDSGSTVNLLSISAARTMMGISPAEIQQGTPLHILGVDGTRRISYGFQIDFRVRATTSSNEYSTWPNVWVFIYPGELPICPILIGQSHGIQEKVFVHHNKDQRRYWVINH